MRKFFKRFRLHFFCLLQQVAITKKGLGKHLGSRESEFALNESLHFSFNSNERQRSPATQPAVTLYSHPQPPASLCLVTITEVHNTGRLYANTTS